MVGGADLGLDLAEELGPPGPVRDGQPGRAAAGPVGPGPRRADDGGGQARPLQPAQRRAPGPRRRLRPLAARGRGRGHGRRRGAARGQPLERRGRAAGRAARALPAGVERTPAASRTASDAGVVAPLRGRAGRRPRAGGRSTGREAPPRRTSSAHGAQRRLGRRDARRARLERRERARPGRRLPRAGRRWPATGARLAEYAELEREPGLAARLRPRRPRRPAAHGAARAPGVQPTAEGGYLHLAWGEAERRFALAALDDQLAQRGELAGVFRDLRDAGEASGDGAAGRRCAAAAPTRAVRRPRPAASGSSPSSGSCRERPTVGAAAVGVVSSERTDLERSAAFRAYSARYQEGRRYLEGRKQP